MNKFTNPNDPDDNRRFKYPCSVELAEEAGTHLYVKVGYICNTCHRPNPHFYVGDDICAHCLVDNYDEENERYKDRITRTLHRKACPTGPHLLLTLNDSKECITCHG